MHYLGLLEKLLSIRIDRLEKLDEARDALHWRCGAHHVAHLRGVGVNLAIQDAVAADNFLTQALRRGRVMSRKKAGTSGKNLTPGMLRKWPCASSLVACSI